MSTSTTPEHRVRTRRLAREWSQAELATQAGISRAAVSAIEGQRLIPSVAAALSIAAALECSVEELFGSAALESDTKRPARWAWTRPQYSGSHDSSRYWCSRVEGQLLFYPVEQTVLGAIPHDGIGNPIANAAPHRDADRTLVMATCDPAAGLLARLYERTTNYRLLVFPRSSRNALDLLRQGLVHVAGLHLTSNDAPDGNAALVRQQTSRPVRLLHTASWQEGIVVGSSVTSTSIRGLLRSRITWIGREPGSGARHCLDSILPAQVIPQHIANDHRGVVDAVRNGWADAGVCLQLSAEEGGLRFLPVRIEDYDLCYLRSNNDDPRVKALAGLIQSQQFRKTFGELPGYSTLRSGTQDIK